LNRRDANAHAEHKDGKTRSVDMFHELDVVRLKHEVPAQSATAWSGVPSTDLVAGEVGTVVMVYTNDSIHYEYEVEFVDADGQTRGLLSLKEDEIELV